MEFLHAMIRVKDEEKSLEFYCDLIGLKKGERLKLEDCELQYLIDEKTGAQIELTINDEIPQNGYNQGDAFGHLAFSCSDFNDFQRKMDKIGLEWEIKPFYLEAINSRIGFILDPDGNNIEIIEKR